MSLRLPIGMSRVHWLLGSWSVLVLLFLYLPIGLLIVYSFNNSRLNVSWEGFTFRWYKEIHLDWYLDAIGYLWQRGMYAMHLRSEMPTLASIPPLIDAVNNSLIIALFTTVVSTVLGTIAGWLLYRFSFPAMRTMSTLVFIPMVVPEVIMGISLRIFFARMNGWTDGNFPLGMMTIIIAHTTFCFPFVMVAVQARLAGLDPALEEAAMDLGATPRQAFMKVIVPYLMPAIISGALMSFTLSFDEYIVTVFVNSADSATFPVKVYGMAKTGVSPTINAICTLFIVCTAMLVLTSEWVKKWHR